MASLVPCSFRAVVVLLLPAASYGVLLGVQDRVEAAATVLVVPEAAPRVMVMLLPVWVMVEPVKSLVVPT